MMFIITRQKLDFYFEKRYKNYFCIARYFVLGSGKDASEIVNIAYLYLLGKEGKILDIPVEKYIVRTLYYIARKFMENRYILFAHLGESHDFICGNISCEKTNTEKHFFLQRELDDLIFLIRNYDDSGLGEDWFINDLEKEELVRKYKMSGSKIEREIRRIKKLIFDEIQINSKYKHFRERLLKAANGYHLRSILPADFRIRTGRIQKTNRLRYSLRSLSGFIGSVKTDGNKHKSIIEKTEKLKLKSQKYKYFVCANYVTN